MRHHVLLVRPISSAALASLGALLLTLHPGALSAKTPDGVPPSQETVCSGLTGAAFGLCNAYCEAQDCDVHPRPSCAQLRRNFARVTGSPVFPCDMRCGDGRVTPPEECDPPGSACGDGGTCAADCTCKQPVCGDGIVDRGEECDPPGSQCMDGRTCTTDCTCATEEVGCCECEMPRVCVEVPPSICLLVQGCLPGPAGTACDPVTERCLPTPPPICCQCGATAPICFDATSPDQCSAQNCTAILNSSCGANGVCL